MVSYLNIYNFIVSLYTCNHWLARFFFALLSLYFFLFYIICYILMSCVFRRRIKLSPQPPRLRYIYYSVCVWCGVVLLVYVCLCGCLPIKNLSGRHATFNLKTAKYTFIFIFFGLFCITSLGFSGVARTRSTIANSDSCRRQTSPRSTHGIDCCPWWPARKKNTVSLRWWHR